MTDDIVARLRDLRNAMNECGFTGISAVTNAAADEIERLRAERDEARRLYCRAVEEIEHGMTNDTQKEVADFLGWDCFKENTNE